MDTGNYIEIFDPPEASDWECHMFGSHPGGCGIIYRPSKGNEPNWFWRWMQFLVFGNRWRRGRTP